MNQDKVVVKEVDRFYFVKLLKHQLDDSDSIMRLKKVFANQLDFLCKQASLYYWSQQQLKPELLRPYLIALIAGESTLEDRFGKEVQYQIQAVHDIAFLREVMVRIKSQANELTESEQQKLMQTSNMSVFREKLNQQQAWIALLKVMQ